MSPQGEQSQAREMAVLRVLLPVPSWHAYSYAANATDLPPQPVGCRVLVPVRRGWSVGFVSGMERPNSAAELKPVKEFLDTEPWLSSDLWELGLWISEYYFCPPGIALRALLPGPLRVRLTRTLHVSEQDLQFNEEDAPAAAKEILRELRNSGGLPPPVLRARVPSAGFDFALRWLLEKGFLRQGIMAKGGQQRRISIARIAKNEIEGEGVTPAGIRLLEALRAAGGALPVAQLIRLAGTTRGPVTTLCRKELVAVSMEMKPPALAPGLPTDYSEAPPPLTAAQREAVEAVERAIYEARFESFLLHGVTASGKTEVYLSAAKTAIDRGKGVICLVPEIGLTAQVVARFRVRFGDRVIVVHSGLSHGQRYDAWLRIREEEAPVVVGPRSAVFAPIRDLGLIIVDEEHDASYKQSHQPRYHARDVALMRASRSECPVILGSATPCLESYRHARSGKYMYLTLDERIDGLFLPPVIIVDMRSEAPQKGYPIFSDILRLKLKEVVEQGNQALLLLNRRGFSRSVVCSNCGDMPRCPDCDIALTFHRCDHVMICHYCGYKEPASRICPSCGNHRLLFGGLGTERVEGQLRELFPGTRVDRMDGDTTRYRGSHVSILKQMVQGDTQILVGTQMIAKGLDLPGVALVGVVNADTPLQFPDFRAGERAFQLLTQVAGRTGRGHAGGEVVMQCYFPDHPALLCAARHDFESFAAEEMSVREEMGYPPFTHLIRVELNGPKESEVDRQSRMLHRALLEQQKGGGFRLLGPAPPLLPRLRGSFRRHLLLMHRRRPRLHVWLKATLVTLGDRFPEQNVRLIIDVDPDETL